MTFPGPISPWSTLFFAQKHSVYSQKAENAVRIRISGNYPDPQESFWNVAVTQKLHSRCTGRRSRSQRITSTIVLAKVAVLGDTFILESKDWTLGPFHRVEGANPCLKPFAASTFDCPVRKQKIHWEDKDLLCAAAVVRNGKVHLLYRAEDKLGGLAGKSKTAQGWGTSRIGLATSEDGLNFTRHPIPSPLPRQ